MITCPSCNHQNPEGSLQCENCYTPLPTTVSCPNCGALVQTDATFCGQCGFNLQAENPSIAAPLEETAIGSLPDVSIEEIPLPQEISLPEEIPLTENNSDILPETSMSSPIQSPWDEEEDVSQEDLTTGQPSFSTDSIPSLETTEVMGADAFNLNADAIVEPPRDVEFATPETVNVNPETADLASEFPPKMESSETPVAESAAVVPESDNVEVPPKTDFATNISGATQLQLQTASLLHLQTNTTIELPLDLDLVHIGKPNTQIPPDIDVAGFPDSEVVSRIHADIRIEGDAYYLEDVGSSNGTYVNHSPLARGNRHKLRPGDRIALGKGDLVTFIFQIN